MQEEGASYIILLKNNDRHKKIVCAQFSFDMRPLQGISNVYKDTAEYELK